MIRKYVSQEIAMVVWMHESGRMCERWCSNVHHLSVCQILVQLWLLWCSVNKWAFVEPYVFKNKWRDAAGMKKPRLGAGPSTRKGHISLINMFKNQDVKNLFFYCCISLSPQKSYCVHALFQISLVFNVNEYIVASKSTNELGVTFDIEITKSSGIVQAQNTIVTHNTSCFTRSIYKVF